MRTLFGPLHRSFALCGILFACHAAIAQQQAYATLPEAPGAAFQSSSQTSAAQTPAAQTPAATGSVPAQDPHMDPQTKRILGIFPNFRAVSADTHLPAQSVKDKFVTATQDSFDYSSLVLPVLLAGEGQATNATPEFHQGAAGYARYFWHTFVDQTSENYMVEFIGPSLTHEDTRYYTLGPHGHSTLRRAGYALSRAVVTRNDSGHDTFNISEVVGAGAAAGISNLYYPTAERTLGNTISKWGTNVGIDAGTFVIREFWPDVNHFLFHGKASEADTVGDATRAKP